MILSDGQINDMTQTCDALVEAAHLPLSVIIIGIGSADFANMHILGKAFFFNFLFVKKYFLENEKKLIKYIVFCALNEISFLCFCVFLWCAFYFKFSFNLENKFKNYLRWR